MTNQLTRTRQRREPFVIAESRQQITFADLVELVHWLQQEQSRLQLQQNMQGRALQLARQRQDAEQHAAAKSFGDIYQKIDELAAMMEGQSHE